MRELFDRLEALAHDGQPRGADAVFRSAQAGVTESPEPGRRSRHRAWIGVGGVVLVLGVGVGSVWLATRESSTTAVRTGPADMRNEASVGDSAEILRLFDTSDEPRVGPEPLYLVPDAVPSGLSLLRASGGNQPDLETSRGGSPDIERQQTWIRVERGAPDPLIDFLTLSWTTPKPPGAQLFAGRGAVPVTVQGRPAVSSGNVVEWQDDDGRIVALAVDGLDADALVAIADGVTRRSDGGYALSSPPEGFALAYEAPGVASDGRNPRELVYSDGAGRGLRVYTTTATENPPGLVLRVPPLTSTRTGEPFTARVDTVRGRPAIVANGGLNGGGGYDQQTLFLSPPSVALRWLEPQNESVVVTAVGLTDAEALAVARGLRPATQDVWDELMAQAPGRDGATTLPVSPPPARAGPEAEIERAFLAWLDADSPDEVEQAIEDGAEIRSAIDAAEAQATAPRTEYSGAVGQIRMVGDDRALVTYTILQSGRPFLPNQQGAAVRIDGQWLVSRQTYCALISVGGLICPT